MLSFDHFGFDCHWFLRFSQKYVLLGVNDLLGNDDIILPFRYSAIVLLSTSLFRSDNIIVPLIVPFCTIKYAVQIILVTRLNYLASYTKYLSVRLRTKWPWVRIPLQSLVEKSFHLF